MNELEKITKNINDEQPKTVRMTIIANTENSDGVIATTKEIMKLIAQFGYSGSWPDDEQWKTILPQWFIKSMTEKSSKDRDKNPNLWHFESWIESMKHRAWVWHSSSDEQNQLKITLELLNIPYIYDQLIYVLYAQGVQISNIKVIDDIYGEGV